MHTHPCRFLLLAALLSLGLASFAAERTLTMHDYTGRGFAPDTVTYAIPSANAKSLRVLDATGQPLAVQVTDLGNTKALLTFVTDLPANATRTFTVRDDGKDAVPATPVAVTADGQALTLANGLLAVKMPVEQVKSFATPVAANTLPAPILAFRGADGVWKGAGQVLATRLVKAFSVSVTARGPVFCEARYELTFAAGGFFRAVVRVEDRVPLAKVTEEYDPGVLDGTDAWELTMTAGWSPDRLETARTNGNGAVDTGCVKPLDSLKEKPSWYLVPDSAWGTPISELGLFNDVAQKANLADYPLAAIVPLHKGDWRNMNALEVQSTGAQDVRVRFPMCRRYASWLREVTSETSPFSMQEHEPGQSLTYARRHWGLLLAKPAMTCTGESGRPCGPVYQARLFYGVVGLDRYKDYQLDWPAGKVTYPRLYLKASEIAREKDALVASSLRADFKEKMLKGTIAFSGDDDTAKKRMKSALNGLAYINQAVFISPTTGHHWTSGQYITASEVDDVLGWAKLPDAVRAEMRSRIALICYLWEEGDIISYADGSHPGNPNMGTARFSPLVSFLPLVPDHPMFPKWRDHMAMYLDYKATSQTVPGGGYFEFGTAYHMHGYARVMNVLPALQDAGAQRSAHLLDVDRSTWRYYMNLLTPVDSRWKYRVIPGLANGMPGYTEHILEASAELAPREPELAANLAWAWRANGENDRGNPIVNMNGQLAAQSPEPKEPALRSEIFPGVGVIFRAHQGPDETYMFLRSGNNWSHWTEDQGHMILLSRGATLLPYQPYQYWSCQNKEFDDHNVVRFGHPENKIPHAWPDSNIIDHAFGPTVDYAWSCTGFPEWYITPGATPEFGGVVEAPVGTGGLRKLADGITQKQGAFDWHRQVMFLKGKTGASPNYFVVRDSTAGDGALASWLTLNLLGTKEGVKVDGGNLLVDTEWPVKLDMRFPQLQTIQPAMYEERQPVGLASYQGPVWWRTEDPISPNWTDRDGKPVPAATARTQNPGFWEQHTMLRIPAAPNAGYLWLLYPRKADEPAPQVTTPAAGVMKIIHPEGTDYAFLSPTPLTYNADGVLFTGCAGAVRVAKDGTVTLALTGGCGKVGYKGKVLSGMAPFEKTLTPAEQRPGETVVTKMLANAYKPKLANHQVVAPGVTKTQKDSVTEYSINAAKLGERISTIDGNIRIEATSAGIVINGATVRFIVPNATYAKLSVGNVGVRGMGPFDLTFAADKITGTVYGATRTIATTWPAQIVRPMYHLDGNRWYAGWADDHAISKGTATPQYAFAFGVTAGKHTVEVSEWTYPTLPPSPARRGL